MLRGSIGNGFHAPSLAQAHYSQIKYTFNPVTNLTAPAALLPTTSPVAAALGATPLRPEKSTDASLGITLAPTNNFNVTIDGYIVTVDHRIALVGALTGTGVQSILTANGFAIPGLSAQYFTNGVDTRTRGLDVVATYRKDLGGVGSLRLSAALNLNKTTIRNIIPNPAALNALTPTPVLFDATTQGYLTSAIPKSKLVLGAGWTWDRLELNVHELRFGSFSVINNVPANSRTFPSAWITNLDVKFHLTKVVSLSAGANNVFNHYPPATAIFAPQYGYNQYPRISPYGITGGSYYVRVQFDF